MKSIAITRRNGDTHEVLLDDVDHAYFSKWAWNYGKGYPYRQYGPKSRRHSTWLHREVLSRKLGRELLPSELTDHINRNTLDCTRDNLRLANYAQNSRNKLPAKPNSTGKRGVSKLPSGRYCVRLGFERRCVYLGSFDTLEEAASAYDHAALELHGDFAVTN